MKILIVMYVLAFIIDFIHFYRGLISIVPLINIGYLLFILGYFMAKNKVSILNAIYKFITKNNNNNNIGKGSDK